jgi:hypothetical protein
MSKIFQAILNFVLIFWAGAKTYIKQNAIPAVTFLQVLKTISDSQSFDWLVVQSKTGVDDRVLGNLRTGLTTAIKILGFANENVNKTDKEIAKSFFEEINKLPDLQRSAILHKASTIIAENLGTNKVFKEYVIDFLLQLAYCKIKAKD